MLLYNTKIYLYRLNLTEYPVRYKTNEIINAADAPEDA